MKRGRRNAASGNSRSREEAKWERTTGALVNRVRRTGEKRRATCERDDESLLGGDCDPIEKSR